MVYLSPDFLSVYKTKDYDLRECFLHCAKAHSHVLRVGKAGSDAGCLLDIIKRLETASLEDTYANDLYCQALFLEFLVLLNRTALSCRINYLTTNCSNPKILEITDFINQHLSWDLTVDFLSSQFFISKYHLMRLFKEETGYTIGGYISRKRLLLAKELILSGVSGKEACFSCGYKDYSTFSRAYKTLFGESPRDTFTLS